jgi:HEAT repeat protein
LQDIRPILLEKLEYSGERTLVRKGINKCMIKSVYDPKLISELYNIFTDIFKREHEKARLRGDIAKTLAIIAKGDKKIAYEFLEKIMNERESMRVAVAPAIGYIGVDDPQIIDSLIAIVNDKKSPMLRSAVIFDLGLLGHGKKNVIDILVAVLKNKDEPIELRRNALTMLGKMELYEHNIAEELLYILDDSGEHFSLRRDTIFALLRIGYRENTFVKKLWEIVEDKEDKEVRIEIRRVAVFALGFHGPYEQNQISALVSIADEPQLKEVCYNTLYEALTH